MNALPLPPLPEGASAWEAVVLQEFENQISRSATACKGVMYADITIDDVKQRFSEAVVQACRNWAKRHGPTKPPFQWTNKALFRARVHVWKDVKRGYRTHMRLRAGSPYLDKLPTENECFQDPVEAIEDPDLQSKKVVAHLFKSLEPELGLVDAQLFRFMMTGATPSQISESACWPEDVAASLGWPKNSASLRHRLFTLRRLALNRLKEWGIESFNDVDLFCAREAPLDDVHAP